MIRRRPKSLARNRPSIRWLGSHRIVATAFHGAPPTSERSLVDHINTNRRNNRPENLHLCDRMGKYLSQSDYLAVDRASLWPRAGFSRYATTRASGRDASQFAHGCAPSRPARRRQTWTKGEKPSSSSSPPGEWVTLQAIPSRERQLEPISRRSFQRKRRAPFSAIGARRPSFRVLRKSKSPIAVSAKRARRGIIFSRNDIIRPLRHSRRRCRKTIIP